MHPGQVSEVCLIELLGNQSVCSKVLHCSVLPPHSITFFAALFLPPSYLSSSVPFALFDPVQSSSPAQIGFLRN